MAQLSTRRLYGAEQQLLKSDIDAFVDDLETFFNVTQLNGDNIQDASITASTKCLEESLSTEKLANDSITTAKILADNITTDKINDSAITTSKILDANITTAKIADSSITTAKVVDASITAAKLSPDSNLTMESSPSIFNLNSSLVSSEGTNFVTVGRPILIMFSGTIGFDASACEDIFLLGDWTVNLNVTRFPIGVPASSEQVFTYQFRVQCFTENVGAGQPCNDTIKIPGSSFKFLDFPAAGTWTYALKVSSVVTSYLGTTYSTPTAILGGTFNPKFVRSSDFKLVYKELY